MLLPRFLLATLLGVVLLAGCAGPREAATPASAERLSPQRNGSDDSPFEPYGDVITDEAESDDGLFSTHRIEDKLYFEIPDSLLGREMLLVSRIAGTVQNLSFGGAGQKARSQQVVRWERQGNDVLLRNVSYESVASDSLPIYQSVRNNNFEPVVASFDIEALNEDSTGVVIDVTPLYTTDVPLIGALSSGQRRRFQVRRLDGDRSFVENARSYPRNVEVGHVLTYEAGDPPDNEATGSISLAMNQSMILLPEDPMMPRLADDRVGYFDIEQYDYGLDEQKAAERSYITRWRLECDGPRDAEGLCTPTKPIVYYIDPATPMKWRPYLKQGVDDWQEAFEAAGFKNAIYAADPPSPEEDPEFSPEDVRYSVIRYITNPIQNAQGPHVHDPRTGEILESDILWYHNVQNLLRNWYFVQTAAVNPEARAVKFEDAAMGELIRFVSAHEVGHTLGLPHNWGSSAAYPVDSLRSPTFTAEHGTAPSIMDYARFNYIAQPEDGVTQFHPKVGEYDVWSIQWGYTPIPQADTPDEEVATLNRWITERADDPRFFYGASSGGRVDPRSQNEDLGDDAVYASQLGLANLQRIVDNLLVWTEAEGKNYDDLEELYGQVVGQWNRYIGHVGRNVGGVYETLKTYDQDGAVYSYVPEERQAAAMAFIVDEVFATPEWLLDEAILTRISGAGMPERIRALQVGALRLLLDEDRLRRVIEAESRHGDATYTMAEMLTDLREGVWAELASGEAVDLYRRNLQRGYVDLFAATLDSEEVADSDIPAYVRGELETLRAQLERAQRRTDDRTTRLHLNDMLVRVDAALDEEA